MFRELKDCVWHPIFGFCVIFRLPSRHTRNSYQNSYRNHPILLKRVSFFHFPLLFFLLTIILRFPFGKFVPIRWFYIHSRQKDRNGGFACLSAKKEKSSQKFGFQHDATLNIWREHKRRIVSRMFLTSILFREKLSIRIFFFSLLRSAIVIMTESSIMN